MATTYVPRPQDIAFAQQIIKSLKHGGTWGLPATQLVYRINHNDKQLELVSGSDEEQHELNGVVFAKVGYKVVDHRNVN